MIKRGFDLITSTIALVVLSPLLLGIAVAIKAGSPGPVFYRGERIGRDGRPFRILKFRTMVVDAEKRGGTSTAGDDPRITAVGRFLRRWKLDELPQLVNVWKGEMSIVGPRPQVRWAVELYDERERELLSVRPGITDWASIRFRNEAEILRGSPDPDRAYLEKIAPEKIRLGLLYVEQQSLWTDLKIIQTTLFSLFKG
jgi:lipopolysaccharide/colanic/teichoic acid biosynthesis glycosyltransferase